MPKSKLLSFQVRYRFGGTKNFELPEQELIGVIKSLLREFEEYDEEHRQASITNSADESITLFSSGLLLLSRTNAQDSYYAPDSINKVTEIFLSHIREQLETDLFGKEPSSIQPLFSQTERIECLHDLAAEGDTEGIKRLLENGENIDETDETGSTPLMYAAMEGHLLACEALLSNGADIMIRDRSGYSAMKWARRHPAVASLLRKYKAPE